MKETIKRSLVKAITWHSVAFAVLVCVVIILDHDMTIALEVAAVDGTIKFICHFLFERGWSHIKWGYNNCNEECADKNIMGIKLHRHITV